MTKKGKKKESAEDDFYPKRAAVDTCVIINAMLRDNDIKLPKDAWKRSQRLIDDGIGGKLELMLPVMVMMELATNHNLRSNRDGVKKAVIDECHEHLVQWCKDAEFTAIELTEDAVDWILDHPVLQEHVRPADAAVLASAKFAGASVVYSWDARFAEAVEKANSIAPLGITVEEPPELPVPAPVEPDDKLLTLFPDEDGDGTE